MSSGDISLWTYVFVFLLGIAFIALGVRFSKNSVSNTDTFTTDIKKGIFHINNATIVNNNTAQ